MNLQEIRALFGPIGLGTFPFSNVFSTVTQDEASAIVKEFIAAGGRYIETAPSYVERGVSLRTILAPYNRNQFVLASKCVTVLLPDGTRKRTGKYSAIRDQCHQELERLGLDYLDLLQAHIPPEDATPQETMNALESLRSEGSVRFIGVSNVNAEQLKAFAEAGRVDFVQNRFSVIHRRAYEEVVEYCASKEIYLNPYQVIERGLLTEDTPLPSARRNGDLRSSKAEYIGEAYDVIRRWFLRVILPIAHELGVKAEMVIIAWVTAQRQVALPVIGATTAVQARTNLAAPTMALDEGTLQKIDAGYRELSREIRQNYGLSIEDFRGIPA